MLNRQLSPRRRDTRGVTLIELLAALMILTVLAALAAPQFQSFMNRTRDSGLELNMRTLVRSAVASAQIDSASAGLQYTRLTYRAFVLDEDINPRLTANGGTAPATQPETVSLVLSAGGTHAALAAKSRSGQCVYMMVIGESVVDATIGAATDGQCVASFDGFTDAGDNPIVVAGPGDGGDADVDAGRPLTIASAAGAPLTAVNTPVRNASYDLSDNGQFFTYATEAGNFKASGALGMDPAGEPRLSIVVGSTSGLLTRADVRPDGGGGFVYSNGPSATPRISSDGCRIVFRTAATNLDESVTYPAATGDPGAFTAVLHDRCASTTRVVAESGGVAVRGVTSVAINAAGDRIVYAAQSGADVAVRVVEIAGDGGPAPVDGGPATSRRLDVAADGSQVASPGPSATTPWVAISPNGRFAAFHTRKPLLPADTDTSEDVYRVDLLAGPSSLVLMSRTGAGVVGDGPSVFPTVANDGVVAFRSVAGNLGVPAGTLGTVIATGGTSAYVPNSTGDTSGFASPPAISRDGRYLAYTSTTAPDETAVAETVFRYDRSAGTSAQAALRPDGSPVPGAADSPTISGDGSLLGFVTASGVFSEGTYCRNAYTLNYAERFTAATTNVAMPACTGGTDG